MWVEYNANPERKHNGDCTVRAISFAMDASWEQTFLGLATEGLLKHDMPSANSVWGLYLRQNGFDQHVIEKTCEGSYTLKDFCAEHPSGVFVVALPGHVVAICDGDYYDTWDSGEEPPLYYWERAGEQK